MRIALLSSFHEKCGIATYSESLAAELEKRATVRVFSPRRIAGDDGIGPQPPRLWNRNRAFGVEAFRVTDRLSDSDRATLMGGTLTRIYNWAPAKA